MMAKKQNLSNFSLEEDFSASGLTFGIVVSDWNQKITSKLAEGCVATLKENGVDKENILIVNVPGSFELPSAARMLDDKYNLDAVICLGCVIQGETAHDRYINQAVATGLVQLGLMRSKPFIFGVLTPNSMQQAEERAGGTHGNKGIEAAIAAMRMAHLRKNLQAPNKKIGFKS